MKNISAIKELCNTLNSVYKEKKRIGLVPTMGYLHEGHLSLIRKAKSECEIVVVSIFVNPTQFAPNEDYSRYPRSIERDSEMADSAGCDILFTPAVEEMYPDGFSSLVEVKELTNILEGKFRPTHFNGVTTIVNKLFNIVQPNNAYFGQKDIQQCIVIKKMIEDLNIPIQIEMVPTVREPDGLALSSRNIYLKDDERTRATVIFQSLKLAEEKIKNGEKYSEQILNEMTTVIQSRNPDAIDYIAIVDSKTLQYKKSLGKGDTIIISLAVRFGNTRLLDNIILTV